MTDLSTVSTAELKAEIKRRDDATVAEQARAANLTFQRTRLAGAVSTARHNMDIAQEEHTRRTRAHNGLLGQGIHVPADQIRNSEIKVEQANRLRTESQDRLIAAERALDAFDRQGA